MSGIPHFGCRNQCSRSVFDGGGGSKREPKARVERRRRETIRDNFKFRISEMTFPGLCKRLAKTAL